jgi:hypothetical protein
MRRSLVLFAGLVLACSEEGGRPREEGMGGAVAQAGSGGAPGSAGSAGSAGSGAGMAGMGGGPDLGGFEWGAPLEFVAGTGLLPYAIGTNAYGIRGGGFLAQSTLGNSITVGSEPGKVCISGNLEEVPRNPDGNGNYGPYWGVEFGFNLNQGAAEGGSVPAPPPAGSPFDAGADGGADAGDAGATAPPMEVAQAWQIGKVVGFTFVIEGPTINLVRFKTLPAGYNRTLESSVFCKEISATSGAVQTALFSEIDQYCWGANQNLLVPTAGGLDNIAWQLPADVSPAGARPFDWCLSDLRPIVRP